GLAERLAVQEILFLELDFRKMLAAIPDLDAASRAGGIPSAIVIQREAQLLGCIEQGRIPRDCPALALRMEKRHTWHGNTFLMDHRFDWHSRIRTALQSNVLFELMAEQFEAALHQHGRTRHERTIPRAFDKPAQLQEAVEILLSALSGFDLRHQ